MMLMWKMQLSRAGAQIKKMGISEAHFVGGGGLLDVVFGGVNKGGGGAF